ncbi:MAG: hypothetical protein OXN17_22715 [Candidatus Poribacteria bacterium]|nr:hypothetical protein [Candidatus Poribacteria bacterium]MDE0506104.1 hypothetical protein [Candidatus Poribacteria bacterium]
MHVTHNGSWRHVIVGLTKMLRGKSVSKIVIASSLCISSVVLLNIGNAHSGSYAGYVSTAEFVEASYAKTVDNTGPKNVSTQQGRINRARSNADRAINGLGYVVGYRKLLGSGSFS